jgi:hypothetical protein
MQRRVPRGPISEVFGVQNFVAVSQISQRVPWIYPLVKVERRGLEILRFIADLRDAIAERPLAEAGLTR